MSYAVLQAAAGFGAEPTTQAEMDQRWRAMCATGGGDWLEASHACSYAPATMADKFNPASYYLGKQLQCGSFGGQWVDKSKSCIFPFTAVVPAVLPPAPTPTPLGPVQPPIVEPPVVTPSDAGTILGLKPLHAAALGIAAVVVVMAARKPAPPKAVPNRRRRRGLLP